MEADNDVRSHHGPVYGGGDMYLGISSDSLEDSDTDSLYEERRYQNELQNRISSNHEDIFQTKEDTEEPQDEARAGDTEDLSHQGKGAKPNIRQQEIRTSYSELRYDPDWRKHQNLLHTSDQDEEEFQDVSSIDSEKYSPDEMTLDTSEDRDNADGHHFWKPLTEVTSKNKKIAATTKQKDGSQIRKCEAHQNRTDKKKAVMPQGEVSKKDIIEKNKVTLGVHKEKTQSYLHMHIKKIEENKAGQPQQKSDVQPMEEGSQLGKEVKLLEAIKQPGLAGSQTQEGRQKTLYMAGALSDINASQWDDMAFYSGEYDNEYMTIVTYPERYKDSSQEDLQIYNEGSDYPSIRHPETRYGRHIMETMGGAQGSMEMYMYPGLSQIGAQTQPGVPGITYNRHNDVFIPSQIIPQTYAPTTKFTSSNNEPVAGVMDKGINERTRSCPSGVRKREEKHQKRLKSFLNEEVKLGGLGPMHTISEERKEQLKQQKEYAKVIQEQNRNKPVRPREIQVIHYENKSTRQKSLEYAKNVPRPQPVLKMSSEKRADVSEKRTMSYDSLFPRMKLLEDLQVRHEKEKMAVAALNALHIL